MEALKHVLAQMGGEGARRIGCLAVNRAATAALSATAVQVAKQSQVFEDLLHGDLLTQEGEVYLEARGRLGRRGWLDRSGTRRYRSSGRGDHFFGGHVPFVAHGLVVGWGAVLNSGRRRLGRRGGVGLVSRG